MATSRLGICSVIMIGCLSFFAEYAYGEPDTALPKVKLLRVPNDGIQPQVAVDSSPSGKTGGFMSLGTDQARQYRRDRAISHPCSMPVSMMPEQVSSRSET